MKTDKVRDFVFRYGTWRLIIQFLSFLFFSAIIFNLGVLSLLLPVMWTWALPQNTVGDAFTAVQLTFSGWRGLAVAFPFLAFASFVLAGMLIGKSMCGWVCPFGFVQDLIDLVRRKKRDFSLRNHESMVYVKYAVLGIALFISTTFAASKLMHTYASYQRALGDFAFAPFSTLSPAETLFGTLPTMFHNLLIALTQNETLTVLSGVLKVPLVFWPQLIILIGVLVFVALVPRGWCRYFCPHGAIMALLNKFSFIGLRRDPVKCSKGGCRLCVEACPMRVPILDLPWEKFSHEECIYCMKCADACKDKAIKPTYP
ncbi:4Fe-4S binding protein [Candidatus Bathyarchaeota archaeon]|nr:4Fe-4S binding protein [Candidatus Bathyarchaeota archaeon]